MLYNKGSTVYFLGGTSMKKMIMKVVTIGFLMTVLASCGKNDAYEQSMRKTKEAIIEKKFEQAEGFVEMALESRPKEEEAKAYQKQIELYNEALVFMEKEDTHNAIVKLDKLISIENGSDKLVGYAKDDKARLSTQTEIAQTDSSSEEVPEKNLWTTEKANALKTFMANFSKTMDQQYQEYNQAQSVDLYGLPLPAAVLDGSWKMAINEQPVDIEWSTTGEGRAPLQLVAVYSDADTQPYLQKHVYFFVLEQGVPKVYVTQQNQGNENNYIYFKESQNGELNQGFSQLIKE